MTLTSYHTSETHDILGLIDTEKEHKGALIELQRMCETTGHMEEELPEMVTKVEAEIVHGLASMAIDVDESDCFYKRYAVLEQSPPLPFEGMDDTLIRDKVNRTTNTIMEEEEISVSPSRKKWFAAMQEENIRTE
ncbi:hypothetical protein SCLCIDRAFT_12273 [Scleroderma citrinum Foug A]|uniref:Uncharacterized protein n=1 Tax=Scleroderma citrinum Foug A TaxID=1036808 RepID=A0A0C3D373_9AGAM|nr:hypothetical protein SCLCIDRAFT_12273 [Scleroderma citrinum Foug A]